uniref:PDZ domain-containing protein n=1 Tax=Haptolina brevifila TaxID=156173 RepID=A0A7S2E271_9EUKA|mmetsp:Transcript_47239/g.94100  ORF Transcript_47239/g.94100 Transcript_47239/m.94100 type:complete len:239 (+) Transcript_47239:56-772(+)|eukprot:CAMPEP_0174733702 /NCGR_PEP_ID=MMETSP1094-20130205/61863_1 /TAXON_ID=156173 /ORGANISM="Chrysochromulina brevifilum, Strain UTEX LB 985" /LENGTH=238 /DNA_ID=CAMNT_0015936401 /DNA_START=56 /DNA_END=772 /DNA_ORIENTATION=-
MPLLAVLYSTTLLLAWSASSVPATRVANVRSGCICMCAPFRSDDEYDYFRRPKALTVTLAKPLGAKLEECSPGGVRVEDMVEGGSAIASGLLKKGDRLTAVQGTDVSTASFDTVMEMLVAAPDEVDLDVVRTVVVRRKKAPAPTLTVDGAASEAASGTILRTAVIATGAELYRGLKAKMSNCGGAGQCATCWVNVVDGMENLSPRTAFEVKKGAKRPDTYRMSCQAVINGDVSVEIPT